MIYDCFIFFNELDVLEIRLNTLNSVVDKFVVVEGTKTFTGLEKPLYFDINKNRFDQFKDKIIHIVVDNYPPYNGNPWVYEKLQRNSIKEGLLNCKDSDIIIISDADEIPNPKKIKKFSNKKGIKVFKQDFLLYFLNNIDLKIPYWEYAGPKMLTYSEFIKHDSCSEKIRHSYGYIINNGGWHFSYIGGVDSVIKKVKSFSHQEYNTSDLINPERIKKVILSGRDVFSKSDKKRYAGIKIDNHFPEYLIENKDKYTHLICPVSITGVDKIFLFINRIKISVKAVVKAFIVLRIPRLYNAFWGK